MEDKYRTPEKSHEINMNNRESLNITGVSHVGSFDEHEVVLETNMGVLVIKGRDLAITQLNLDEGNLSVEGLVKCLDYAEEGLLKDMKNRSKGVLGKIFG